ncbi:hypothetical protein HPE56_15705 [Maribacter sp. ANRC-HE7]|uniref:DUF6265 domain-containing protein n=1 Tax=Maribacter aquimaris TaxID=2737171 RepID=A0ABR7V3M0_9FLAO|nr:DUF6265 family protein [Maribacter aquimaris]MBD0779246.1 hypothetical protein [Maribacter aquimaris]
MKPIFILAFCISMGSFSQHTVSFTETSGAPKATLDDVAWIAGHWKGEAFGGVAEEIWSPPLGDSMMFVFKLVTDGKVHFYEVGHIQQRDETLILQLKHFHGSLKGWEEKDETVDFKLVKMEDHTIYFDDFTIERISENEINMYVVVDDGQGASEEVKFNYKREK